MRYQLNDQQGTVEALLLHGEQNAKPCKELVEALGLHSTRELRARIERERANGALILSTVRGHGGYFLPDLNEREGRAELRRFIRTVHARAVSSQRMLRTARQALRTCPGQEAL